MAVGGPANEGVGRYIKHSLVSYLGRYGVDVQATLKRVVGLVVHPQTQVMVDVGNRSVVSNRIEHSNDAERDEGVMSMTAENTTKYIRRIPS